MINYAKHDEEFYGIFKLVNGDEVLGKAVLTEDEGETLVFIQDPVCTQIITRETDDDRVVRGLGFTRWMNLSDEEFYILREKDIVTVASMSKQSIFLYETFLLGDDVLDKKKEQTKTDIKNTNGYVGKIGEARKMFERIFKEL
jgi:hypothetical protein